MSNWGVCKWSYFNGFFQVCLWMQMLCMGIVIMELSKASSLDCRNVLFYISDWMNGFQHWKFVVMILFLNCFSVFLVQLDWITGCILSDAHVCWSFRCTHWIWSVTCQVGHHCQGAQIICGCWKNTKSEFVNCQLKSFAIFLSHGTDRKLTN